MTDLLLRVEGLTKRFGPVVANDDVSFEVRRGELHCLLGENGAGKSTLSSCIYGLYRPERGRLYWQEREVSFGSPGEALRLGIGMVHQHFVLVPAFTVIENIIVGTNAPGIVLDVAAAARRLDELCRIYDLEADLHAEVGKL